MSGSQEEDCQSFDQSGPWRPCLMAVGHQSNNTWSAPHKEHLCHVWFKSTQRFLRRRSKCKKFTTDDGRTDDRRKVMAKAHPGLWPGELKRRGYGVKIHDTKSLHAQDKIESKGTALLLLFFRPNKIIPLFPVTCQKKNG